MKIRFWTRHRPDPGPKPGDPDWERALVGQVVREGLAERRSARRWGVLFKLLAFVYLFALLVLVWPPERGLADLLEEDEGHTALIELDGLIAPGIGIDADQIAGALRKAFEDERTKGIVLRCNSPGGSPVQAGYINDEIRRLRGLHTEIPVYAVIADVCASGGYYVAVAADEIYADKASLVGSIGVRMSSFGVDRVLDEFGVERRLLTGGEHKAIFDPFSPLPEEERAHLQSMIDQVHRQFIDVVEAGRGDRLRADPELLFSGLYWSGEEALRLGLVDGLGSSGYVARELIGADTLVEYTPAKDLLERLADGLGMAVAKALVRAGGVGW